MSEIEVLKNTAHVATVGIPPLQIPIDRHRFPQQEAHVAGVEVFIAPGGIFEDKNGVVHGAFKSDSEAVFVNCAADVDGVPHDEAIALRIPERNYGWLHDRNPLRRGPHPRTPEGNKEPGWRFMGWFGVSSVVKDDNKAHAERIKNAQAGPTEVFRQVQRLEARVVELTNQVGVLGSRNKELAEQCEAYRAEIRLLKGPEMGVFTPPASAPVVPAVEGPPALPPNLQVMAAAVAPKPAPEPPVKADPEASGPQHQNPPPRSRR